METFFFVTVTVLDVTNELRFGPYTTLGTAAEIMVDCLPHLIQAEAPHLEDPKYVASMSEWTISDEGWTKIATRITENRG